MHNYAVLRLPEFPLQALQAATRGAPAAVIDSAATHPAVLALSAPARACGVRHGMPLPAALAHCPQLQVLHRDRARESQWQSRLIAAASYHLSPVVESTADGVVTVELPERCIGKSVDYERDLVAPWQRERMTLRIGIAPTPDIAAIASRDKQSVTTVTSVLDYLTHRPVTVLEPEPALEQVLELWGIRTVGDLLALPANELVHKLGRPALDLLHRAQSRRVRPLRPVLPAPTFHAAAETPHGIERLEELMEVVRRLLNEVRFQLALVYRVFAALTLEMRFEDESQHNEVLALAEPTEDLRVIERVLLTRLERLTAPSPLMALALHATPACPVAEQGDLWQLDARDRQRYHETLARLAALLGQERVGLPLCHDTHRADACEVVPAQLPGSKQQLEPRITRTPVEACAETGWSLLRFRPAQRVRVTVDRCGQPQHLHAAHWNSAIQTAHGPWRTNGEWWMPQQRWQREEWDIITPQGSYRLSQIQSGGKSSWQLEGIYG